MRLVLNTAWRYSPEVALANSMRISHRAIIRLSRRLSPSATRASFCSAGPMCVRPNEGWPRPPSVKGLQSRVFFPKLAFRDFLDSWLGGVACFSPETLGHGPYHLGCRGMRSIWAGLALACVVAAA